MSIRLRLTLIYSVMLALILVGFSLVLYLGQASAIRQDLQRKLEEEAQAIIEQGQPVHDQDASPVAAEPEPRHADGAPPPRPSGMFYIQTRDIAGQIIERDPALGDEMTLPLSPAGLQATQNGQPWVEIDQLGRERVLVYSQAAPPQPEGDSKVVQVAGALTSRDNNLGMLRNILIVVGILTVGVTVGLVWLLASLALRPIHRLTQTAQEIGASRDFGRRVDHAGPDDELGWLAITFNGMLAELQASYLQVEQTLQAQRRFVADASHELGTPLTTIRGNLGLLQREPPISTVDRSRVLNDMVEETERLMRLSRELLTLARTELRQPLQREPILLQPLLEDLCSQFMLLAPHRKIRCMTSPETVLQGDRDVLRQILMILLDNARKHTPEDTTISLSSTTTNEYVTVSVSDNGPGIAPDILPHIFDRFFRGDSIRHSPGTGLGLAIARELTVAMGGTLAVVSQVGQGSAFTLTIQKNS